MARNVVTLYAEGLTLEEIVHDCDDTPDRVSTITIWAKSMPHFAQSLMDARLSFSLIHAESTLSAHLDNRDPQMARIQIQAAQWLASKYDPKVYGEKLSVEIEHKIDLTQAIEDARERALALRSPLIEHDEVLD